MPLCSDCRSEADYVPLKKEDDDSNKDRVCDRCGKKF